MMYEDKQPLLLVKSYSDLWPGGLQLITTSQLPTSKPACVKVVRQHSSRQQRPRCCAKYFHEECVVISAKVQ